MSKAAPWIYGVAIHQEDGDFVVSVRDLPEVCTSGSTLEEALEMAADAIDTVAAWRMKKEKDLPLPSKAQKGEHAVPLPAPLAAKASVYHAWKAAGINKAELARRMGAKSETEARRILDPNHGTRLDQLEEAAEALGGHLSIGFVACQAA